jgi:hypothetical protein
VQRLRPQAQTDESGAFQLRTYVSGDGAPPGQYKVTIIWPGPSPDAGGDSDKGFSGPDRLGGRYADPDTSPFSVTVVEEENRLDPLDLK